MNYINILPHRKPETMTVVWKKKTYEIVVFDNQSRSSTYGQGAALADEGCKIKQHRQTDTSAVSTVSV